MAYKPVPEELFEADITAAQFRALAIISINILSQGKWTGYCCLGYTELAKSCYTTKSSMINTISQLQKLGYLEITKRDAFNRSNAIKLTILNGLERSLNTSGDLKGCAPRGSFFDTPKGSLKDTPRGSLNDTLKGSFFDTPYIDLKFKNLNLKTKNARACAKQGSLNDTPEKEHIAPADGAAGRSKPIQNSAGDVLAESQAAKPEEQLILQAMKEKFRDIFSDISLSKAGNTYILRKKGKYALVEDVRIREVVYWLCSSGLDARILDCNTRVVGEVIIDEVA